MKYNRCQVIGLTGGIASGKSTLVDIIKKKGFQVIDADQIARQVVKVDRPAYKHIVDYFGPGILKKDRTIDRKVLGDLVFNNREELEKLNSLSHPYIYEEIKNQMADLCKKEKIIFLDIPLLFEEMEAIGSHGITFDQVWLVYVDEKIQLERLMKRNNLTEDEAQKRINAQMSLVDKMDLATEVIDNNKSLGELEEKVKTLIDKLVIS